MNKQNGFTLIELVMFIIITSILASAILLSFVTAMSNMPTLLQNTIAMQTAKQCMEFFVGQRRKNGYNSITCNATALNFCPVPTGYTVNTNCSVTTLNSDSNYATITVTVGGLGNAVLNFLMAVY